MAKMTRLLVALVLASVTAAGWYGIASAATCYTCHAPVGSTTDLRPVESTYRNITTGSIKGSHAKHIPAPTTDRNTCTPCHIHAADISFTTRHRDGFIQVSSVMYSKSASFPQSGNPTLGTCSAATCHADPYGPALVVSPVWGQAAANCTACHTGANAINATGPATGSHTTVAGHAVACTTCHATGTTVTTAPTFANGHNDGNIDVANVGYATLNKTKGTAGTTCSTAICHGSASPAWGTNSTNYACTKCHGTGTVTVTAGNYEVVAPSGASSDTGQVSTGKIGAHQTHLKYFNGLSQQGADPQARCQICHTIPGSANHATGNATPTFTGLALGTGTYAASYVAGTCSVYCHNPAAATGGTLATTNAPAVTTVSWTDAAYIADVTLKTDANCNKCHKAPNGSNVISSVTSHAGFTIATACTPCHEHDGGTGGSVGRQHMDGAKWGSGGAGGCVGCHGYGVGTWAAAPEIDTVYHQGKGAHEKHISYLTTKRFTITLAPLTDAYNAATPAWTNVCGICHGSTSANHTNGAVNVSVSSTYLFGTGATLYSGVPGTSSATNAKTCSNVSCHYFTTPLWSTY